MEESSEIVIESKKKPALKKYILAAVIIFLCIFAGYIYKVITWEPKSDPASEVIIRRFAAKELNKNPNKLTDKDFARVTELSIDHQKLYDIKNCSKSLLTFKNLILIT